MVVWPVPRVDRKPTRASIGGGGNDLNFDHASSVIVRREIHAWACAGTRASEYVPKRNAD